MMIDWFCDFHMLLYICNFMEKSLFLTDNFGYSFIDPAKSIEEECKWEDEFHKQEKVSVCLPCPIAISKKMVRCRLMTVNAAIAFFLSLMDFISKLAC